MAKRKVNPERRAMLASFQAKKKRHKGNRFSGPYAPESPFGTKDYSKVPGS